MTDFGFSSGHNLRVIRSSPVLGFVLNTESALGSLSLSLCASLSQINKQTNKLPCTRIREELPPNEMKGEEELYNFMLISKIPVFQFLSFKDLQYKEGWFPAFFYYMPGIQLPLVGKTIVSTLPMPCQLCLFLWVHCNFKPLYFHSVVFQKKVKSNTNIQYSIITQKFPNILSIW